jgi:hypothetical protein
VGSDHYRTVQVGLVLHPHQNNTSILSFSTYDNSTTIAPINKAIADLKLHEQDEDFSIRGIAKKHDVEYSTLRRRWTGQTGPRAARYASQQLLSPQQEEGPHHRQRSRSRAAQRSIALVASSRSKPLPYTVQNRHRLPLNPIYELRLRARLQLRPTNDHVRPQFTSRQYN